MSIPPITHPIWNQMIKGQISWNIESLAIKIFIGAARLQLTQDSSGAQLNRLTRELHDLFTKNEKLPSVQKDLARIN